jgi:oxalate decarboxylase
MNKKEYDAILDRLSRRNFLRAGSGALAATVLAAATTARGQERASTRTAEHDRSASDPGPENKALLEANPDSNLPPPTDHGDVVPLWYSFDLVKKRIEEGGWTHEVTQRELPSSKDIAAVNMRLTAGSYRELHWHTADEWAYVLYGKARVTVMTPDGLMFIGDVSEGDLWLFPAGHPHSIQGLDPDGTEFLLVFNQGDFSEDGTMLLSEWMAHTPPEVLMKNFGLDRAALATLPTGALYIFPNTLPVNTVDQDKEEIGGGQVLTPNPHTFKMKSMAPTKTTDGGQVRIVDSGNFPLSTHVAAALVTLKPGAMRELHWHPHSSEWQYWIAGQGRMTVFFPVDNARTVDFKANDVGYVPSNSGHYIENTGDTDAIFLEMLPAAKFEDVSLNQWLRRLPPQMVQAHLGFDKGSLARIPDAKLVIV